MSKTCPNCGKTHEAVERCPYCNAEVPKTETPITPAKPQHGIYFYVGILLIFLIALLVGVPLIIGAIAPSVNAPYSTASSSGVAAASAPTSDPRSALVKFGKGDGYLYADVTNIGSSSESFFLVVDFYDNGVKVDTRTPGTPMISPGETGRVKIYPPSDATSYRLDGVAVKIGGSVYKVYYDVEYV